MTQKPLKQLGLNDPSVLNTVVHMNPAERAGAWQAWRDAIRSGHPLPDYWVAERWKPAPKAAKVKVAQ